MPNHFHFLIYSDERTVLPVLSRALGMAQINNSQPIKTKFSEAWRIALSSYTQAINRQEQRTGSLFTQNTKNKQVSDEWMNFDYRHCCFSYIHQNPISASLVKKLEDWEFSSYRDYIGIRNGTLCNKQLAYQLMGFDSSYFEELHSKKWDKKIIDSIF